MFASFPEALLILILGLSLTNCKCITAQKCIMGAAFQSIISLIISYLGMPFGLHSIVYLFSYYIIFIFIFRINFKKAVFPLLIGALIQGFIQSFSFSIGTSLLKWNIASVINNFERTIVLSLPSSAISLFLIWITRKNNIIIWDINH